MRLLGAVLLLSLIAQGALAQRMGGRILLPNGSPAPRILVEATTAAGDVVARALSDQEGRFMVALPRPGRYGLRALRIGYRPTLVAPRTLGEGDAASVAITLTAEVATLPAIRVTADNAVCTAGWRGDPNVQLAWEEARKAFATAQVTADQSELAVSVRSYEGLAPADGEIHPATFTAYWRDAASVRPFAAVAESTLVAEGYAKPLLTGETVYRAPDFDALLAPSFLATHCMRLVPAPAARPGAIGIAFEPNLDRMRPDIAGTVWMDRETGFLQEVEFRFTSIVGGDAARQGGHVAFTRLGTGHWIVNAWELRMPRAGEQALTVIGGEVGEVTLAGEVVLALGGPYVDTPPTPQSVVAMTCGLESIDADWGLVRGELVDAEAMPVANANVTLTWADGGGERDLSVLTATDGTWHACRVPLARRLKLTASVGELRGRAELELEREVRLAELAIALRP